MADWLDGEFRRRHRDIEATLDAWRPAVRRDRRGVATAESVPALFSGALDALFGPRFNYEVGHYASWINGIALPGLLTTRRRLTVDITADFLNHAAQNYGLSEGALLEFAKAGLLFFNIRNYDPAARDEDGQARNAREVAALQQHESFMTMLMEVSPQSIYFLPSLRDRLFNMLDRPGSPSIRSYRDEAAKKLDGAFQSLGEAYRLDANYMMSVFRSEAPSLVSTAWHWAYVKSVAPVMFSRAPELFELIQERYQSLYEKTEPVPLAGALLSLVRMLRYAHLLFSAPLSASFGGTYNVQLDGELSQMREIEMGRFKGRRLHDFDLIDDEFLRFLYGLQVGKLRSSVADRVTERQWLQIKGLGVTAALRTEEQDYHVHYDDNRNQHELINYFYDDDDDGHRKLAGIHADIIQRADRMETIETDFLTDIAHIYNRVQVRRNVSLESHTEAYQANRKPSRQHGSQPGAIIIADARIANFALRAHSAEPGNITTLIGSARDGLRDIVKKFTTDPGGTG